MSELTIDHIVDAVRDAKSFNNFRQYIMHTLGETTPTDEAIHVRNLRVAALIRSKEKFARQWVFRPEKHKASFIEDEFEEFR